MPFTGVGAFSRVPGAGTPNAVVAVPAVVAAVGVAPGHYPRAAAAAGPQALRSAGAAVAVGVVAGVGVAAAAA